MCMEDIRIGRQTRTNTYNRLVDVTPTLLVDGELTRTILIISSPKNDNIWISPDPNIVVDTGMQILQGTDPVKLTIESAGDWITKPLYAITFDIPQHIGVIEGLLNLQ
jgi:hypothetical protein